MLIPNLLEQVAGNKIPGAREYQEDAFQIRLLQTGNSANNLQDDSTLLLLVLADGMGGHVGGARASDLAVTTFITHFESTNGAVNARLHQSLNATNEAIAEDTAKNPRYCEMGCTLLACVVVGNKLHWLSVGDSPLWLLRENKMLRLNADHSMRPVLQDLVELGRMSAEDMENDRRINQLRSALTGGRIAQIDQNQPAWPLAGGDRVILASDGLETLSVDEIGNLCGPYDDPKTSVTALLDEIQARQRPGQDNATVVIYRHIASTDYGVEMEAVTQPGLRHPAPNRFPPKKGFLRRLFKRCSIGKQPHGG